MGNIDFASITSQIVDAFKVNLSKNWKEIKPYAEKEAKAFTENLKLIAELKLSGKIDEETARLHVEIQKNSMRIVLLTIKGLSILTVENAINAALAIIRTAVNAAIGWPVL